MKYFILICMTCLRVFACEAVGLNAVVTNYDPSHSVVTFRFTNSTNADWFLPSINGKMRVYYEFWNADEEGVILVDPDFLKSLQFGAFLIDEGLRVPKGESVAFSVNFADLCQYGGSERAATGGWNVNSVLKRAFRLRLFYHDINKGCDIESRLFKYVPEAPLVQPIKSSR